MSVRRSPGWPRRALTCGALLACAALTTPQAAYADPDPGGRSPGGQASDPSFIDTPPPTDRPAPPGGLAEEELRALLDRLQSLYRTAEEAAEEYNTAQEKLDEARRKLDDLNKQLGDQRADLRENRAVAGELARRQYRDLGLSDYSRLLLSDDPREAFDRGHDLNRAAEAQAEVVRDLAAGERDLKDLVDDQKETLEEAEGLAERQRAARDKVEKRLEQVEDIVSTLTGAEREELKRLEEEGTRAAQEEFVDSGVLGHDDRNPSGAGQRAIDYAFDQLGDPYLWGAEGPDAFDCSGLTSRAWEYAGTPIPRTSQEQWRQLPRVPMNQLRPGDLVIYYPGATHVAMYIGDGKVVQAPRTGDVVKVSPVGGMPVLGAVRPDPGERAVDGAGAPKPPARS
ncbi:NlpC/P60 family protein [Streptomyces capparidis]